jgi:hypothetical protein
MSHFTTIKTQIKDINALRLACSELSLGLLQNAIARGYGNSSREGDYVIQVAGPYDIAVEKQKDGTFGLTTDWWGGHVEAQVGKDFGKLLQLYGVHKASLEAKKKGYSVLRHARSDGSIKLVLLGVAS